MEFKVQTLRGTPTVLNRSRKMQHATISVKQTTKTLEAEGWYWSSFKHDAISFETLIIG